MKGAGVGWSTSNVSQMTISDALGIISMSSGFNKENVMVLLELRVK